MLEVKKIVLVGASYLSWMAAALLSKRLSTLGIQIHILDGGKQDDSMLAESLTPASLAVNKMLGLPERPFMAATQASFKLANEYRDWRKNNDTFFHSFNHFGCAYESVAFQHLVNASRLEGYHRAHAVCLDDYSLSASLCRQAQFTHPDTNSKHSALAPVSYGFHIDLERYQELMKRVAIQSGVVCTKAEIDSVQVYQCDERRGHIESLNLKDGSAVSADLFIDFTGSEGQLIDGAMHVDYHDLTRVLPCDHVWSYFSDENTPFRPATALGASPVGWWRLIPLQHKSCYEVHTASGCMSDNDGMTSLMSEAGGEVPSDNLICKRHVRPGFRRAFWRNNCVAMGAAAGYLGSFSISDLHLVQSAVLRLLDHFPFHGPNDAIVNEYNKISTEEFERIADFHALHYSLARKHGGFSQLMPLDAPLTDSLEHKLRLFSAAGILPFYERETVSEKVWVSYLLGNDFWPRTINPLAGSIDISKVDDHLHKVRQHIQQLSTGAMSHRAFLQTYCPAPTGGINDDE